MNVAIATPFECGDSGLILRGRPTISSDAHLAGHQELGTTQRYMQLSPAALDRRDQVVGISVPAQSWRKIGDAI
jgi:hypothetical protein